MANIHCGKYRKFPTAIRIYGFSVVLLGSVNLYKIRLLPLPEFLSKRSSFYRVSFPAEFSSVRPGRCGYLVPAAGKSVVLPGYATLCFLAGKRVFKWY